MSELESLEKQKKQELSDFNQQIDNYKTLERLKQ